ncbi:MAG TPA: hypothetical protein VFC53_09440 [Dehalococcoidia bacterium]|nr:hypothetical protein [Dehalococcoidia bacterium]
MKIHRYAVAAALMALAALAMAACGSGTSSADKTSTANAGRAPTQAGTPSSSTPAAGDENASIEIVSPAADATAAGDRLEVRVRASGLKFDGTKIGQPAAQNPRVGHWHVYVDGKYAGLSVSDVISLPNDAMPQIPAGEHEIKVQLHHTDHTPLMPEKTDSVMVNFPQAMAYTAAPGSPSIEIVSPSDGATLTDQRLVVRVKIGGLRLDGTKIGQPAAQNPGVGHWHVYVDGKYAGLSVSDEVSLPNDAMPQIASGPHEIKVQLHNTDHTPLTPEVSKTIMVTFP